MSHKSLLIGVVCVVLGSFGAIRNWVSYSQDTAIVREGARAEGYVTRKWVSGDSESGEDYMIAYWFELPAGARIEAQHRIAESRYRGLRPGSSIGVLYSRLDPRQNFPERDGATSRRSALIVSSGNALLTLFGVTLVVLSARKRFAVS